MIAYYERRLEAQHFELHADNLEPFSLFIALATQWRYAVGMSSVHALGLDYAAVEPALRLRGTPRKQWTQLFDDLQVMEAAALKHMNAKVKP